MNVKACEAEEVCRWCSWAGFVNFKIQNRELPYANERRGKPVSQVFYHVDVQIIAANGPAV
jgi:hypothetical protein